MGESLQERTTSAWAEGYSAALRGEAYSSCPYRTHQGSPTRVEGLAWRKGFQVGERDEAEGHHFRSPGH